MGRRNWLQTGSHFSAQNLAFMFGLLESCKLNKVNFGEYIGDILTCILCGEEVDASFLPCDYALCHRLSQASEGIGLGAISQV